MAILYLCIDLHLCLTQGMFPGLHKPGLALGLLLEEGHEALDEESYHGGQQHEHPEHVEGTKVEGRPPGVLCRHGCFQKQGTLPHHKQLKLQHQGSAEAVEADGEEVPAGIGRPFDPGCAWIQCSVKKFHAQDSKCKHDTPKHLYDQKKQGSNDSKSVQLCLERLQEADKPEVPTHPE